MNSKTAGAIEADRELQRLGTRSSFVDVNLSRRLTKTRSLTTESDSSHNMSVIEKYLKRKLGPRDYKNMVTAEDLSLTKKSKVAEGWERKVELEDLSRRAKKNDHLMEREVGPGSYEIKDFLHLDVLKPRGIKGVMGSSTQRFTGQSNRKNQPDPAAYGVPEKSTKKSYALRGLLDCGSRCPDVPVMASHLAPGNYNLPQWPDCVLEKVVSKRGPYDLWSGGRGDAVKHGFQATPKQSDLGPGEYEYESFVDKVIKKSQPKKGGKLMLTSISTRIRQRPQTSIGKKPSTVIKVTERNAVQRHMSMKWPAFGSTNSRNDKLFTKRIDNNFNSVGIGRYNVGKDKNPRDVNGGKSVFMEKTAKPKSMSQKWKEYLKEHKDKKSTQSPANTRRKNSNSRRESHSTRAASRPMSLISRTTHK